MSVDRRSLNKLLLVLFLCSAMSQLLIGSAWARIPIAETSGELALVTYNIAGLPEGISKSRPRTNIPLIAPLLADYHIALVQEDFSYQTVLRAGITQRYHSPPHPAKFGFDIGSGLSRFAHTPFTEPLRFAWERCNGYLDQESDCLAPKGFSFARHQLTRDVELDVYNVHFDAGWSESDSAARSAQIAQLAQAIARHSQQRAVIVAGDTNMSARDASLLMQLKQRVNLRDSCQVMGCPQPRLIDRVLFRSADFLHLEPRSWSIDSRFVDSRGRPLSDHLAVAVKFTWRMQTHDTWH